MFRSDGHFREVAVKQAGDFLEPASGRVDSVKSLISKKHPGEFFCAWW
jgi:hypothetical protein